MRRRRLSKKKKIRNGSESLPPDLVIEILKRLPVKVVSRFLLVSKLWSTVIRSQDFIRSFPFPPSILQPQSLLFALNSLDNYSGHGKWLFYSSSSTLSEEKKLVVSFLSRTQCQIPSRRSCDAHYVNGLISLGYGQQQIITNPSTGKSIYLPKVKSRKKIIQSFFGYDPKDGQYKVLCMSERVNDYLDVPSSEHQVFTLGGEGRVEQSWRMIECNILHRPKTNGVCINGVLYYGAFTGTDMIEWCLIRFDVRTEKLDLLSGLNETSVQSFGPQHSPCLINYQGKVTLAFESSLHTFDLWVMEDAEKLQKWSKIHFSMRHRIVGAHDALRITCTIHTGEINFVLYRGGDWTHVVYYDCKKNIIRVGRVDYDRMDDNRWYLRVSEFLPFYNYVESAMLL